MSIEERIAEIVTTHRRSDYWGGPDWDCDAPDCHAGGNDHADYAAHVASVLVAELGLEAQHRWTSSEEVAAAYAAGQRAGGKFTLPSVVRYVTRWTEES